jgi:copper chaperone NosL
MKLLLRRTLVRSVHCATNHQPSCFLKMEVIMTSNKLQSWVRLTLLICGIALAAVLVTPIWKINLDAPQYPEGLELKIYASKLGGNVDIINGLNHYIGMKTLHATDFIEFTILNYIIGFFAIVFIAVAGLNKRKLLNILFFSFVAFGIIAMTDFWRWEYNYGHNLDPNAAIIVPGMSYQPPLIGFKQLLNFGAYSIPDIGGWIFIAVGALVLLCFVLEFKRNKQFKKRAMPVQAIIPLLAIILMSSCNTQPEAIKVGTDNCYFCKMTITDAKFGAELITQKGKIFKFDDVHCILSFLKTKTVEEKEISGIYLVDFSSNHQFVKSTEAKLLQQSG